MTFIKSKEYHLQLKYWNERNEIRIEVEEKLRIKIRNRLEFYIERAKEDFKQYLKNENFLIIEMSNYVEASFEGIKARIVIKELGYNTSCVLELHITNQNRQEKFIAIHSKTKFYYPSINKIRTTPKDITLLKKDIKAIDEEILFLNSEINKIDKINFEYSFYDEAAKPDFKELKTYHDITEILNELF